MDREDDFELGARRRREMLGDAWVQRSLGEADALTADFQALITRYAWHEIWNRPGLDPVTRRLLVLGMTMAAARWEEFELHCRAAVRGGVPWPQIQETLMQGAIYCGVPAANTAIKITRAILRDEGIALPPAPLTPGHRVQLHRTFSAPSLRVAVQGEGPGVPVVLSHALGLDLHSWEPLAESLAARHPVLRYDHRGQGGSALPAGRLTLDDLVDDAARVIREWGRGPVLFVGISMGGIVGQGLAIRHPQLVRGVVLANTSARYPQASQAAFEQRAALVESGGMAAVVESTLERFLRPEVRAARPELVQAVRHALRATNPAAYAATVRAIAMVNWLDQLPGVACPALVIAGRYDVGATPEMAEAIAAALPRSTLVVLEGASHLSAAEDPAGFGAALDRFVRALGAAGAPG
jgi:3-oxoadipate enol-lactonase